MTKIFIKELRELLVKHTGGCAIQEASDGALWPCGTCVCALFASVLDDTDPQYREHNDNHDRVNELWRAILQIRDNLPDDNEPAPENGGCIYNHDHKAQPHLCETHN
jgi:hypothetical protein